MGVVGVGVRGCGGFWGWMGGFLLYHVSVWFMMGGHFFLFYFFFSYSI